MKKAMFLAVVLVAGCAQGIEVDSKAKELVGQNLKDPGSAKWGEIRSARFHEGYVACGTVNSKNSFGGYTGDSPFVAMFTPDGNGSADVAEDANLGILMIARCEIMFDIAKRRSDASKWPQEKKELTDRVVKSTQALVAKMKF